MKAVVFKPLMWNPNGYRAPGGYPATSGFSKDNGYGHEEWNNNPKWKWGAYRVFHTQSTERLDEFGKTGELGLLMVAAHGGQQYLVGAAVHVFLNSDAEKALIAKELRLEENWKQPWQLRSVKRCFGDDSKSFRRHWESHYQSVHWKAPKEYYFWLPTPFKLTPRTTGHKNKLIMRHGRYERLGPRPARQLLAPLLPKAYHGILEWLKSDDFDEEMLPGHTRSRKQSRKGQAESTRDMTNSPAKEEFLYWVMGERHIYLEHHFLQRQFLDFLRATGKERIEPDESYIDVQYRDRGEHFIVEVKPTSKVETRFAIRNAVGQLLEHRFRQDTRAKLEIVLGSKPKSRDVEFAQSLDIELTYYGGPQKGFVRCQ